VPRRKESIWFVALILLAACRSGVIGNPAKGGPGGSGPSGTTPPGSGPCANAPVTAGSAPLRRLTTTEWDNSVNAIFNLAMSEAATTFPADGRVDGYDNAASQSNISATRADAMLTAAETIAQAAAANLQSYLNLICPNGADDTCALDFIKSFGLKIYRRPLAADELTALETVWTESATISKSTSERFELVIEAMLMAPQFSYKSESGDPTISPPSPNLVGLSGYEIAARMAFLFWSTTPDDQLLMDAASGTLSTTDGIERVARRMLGDQRARFGMQNFTSQWLELWALDMLPKDTTMFPQWTDALVQSIRSETERFMDDLVWAQHQSLRQVLTSNTTFVDSKLASLYGIDGLSFGSDGWTKVNLPAHREGVLTQASFLSAHAHGQVTSPVRRGLFVRRKFLCQDLPPPPNNVVITVPTPDANSTNRQRMSQHDKDPACSGCHHLMDPIGFGFETFDAIGQYQDHETNGLAIDSSGTVYGTNDIDGAFNGATELIQKLASTKQVDDCMVLQTFRYAQGRRDEMDDQCALSSLKQSFGDKDQDLLELMVDLVKSDFFRYRPVVE
jgi:hypothetical protein